MDIWNTTPIGLDGFSDIRIGEHDQLEHIQPRFFFAPLKNTPQDPILDAIKRAQAKPKAEHGEANPPHPDIPKELAILTADLGGLLNEGDQIARASSPTSFWYSVLEDSRRASVSSLMHLSSHRQVTKGQDNILSWDHLRPTHSHRASTTAFLSEQADELYASARE